MAFKHGKSTTVLLGSVNVTPRLNSIDFAAEAERADTTMFGATWKTSEIGTLSATLDFAGLYDPAQADFSTQFLSLVPGILTYCPGSGAAAGDPARLVSALDTSFALSSPVGGMVAINGSIAATGLVGWGQVLEPLTARSGNANGTALDLGTAAAGAVAHLHATAVSADHVQVQIEDSATGSSDWQDVSGFDFTELSVPGSERRIVTGTVRRYVRAVWTHDGAVTSSFFLAIARTTPA